jgi:copper chaperone CopZ
MTTVTYFIPNISCGHCAQRIKTSLIQLEGVRAVEANPEQREALIEFEPPATQEAIKALLEEIHYPVAE